MEERHLHMLHGVTKKGLDTGVSKSHPFTTCDTDSYEAPIIPLSGCFEARCFEKSPCVTLKTRAALRARWI